MREENDAKTPILIGKLASLTALIQECARDNKDRINILRELWQRTMTQPPWLGAKNGCLNRSVNGILKSPESLLLINAPSIKRRVSPPAKM